MDAASRQSYATALDRLNELAADAGPEQVRTAADELAAVAGLLNGQVRLRRALADPSRGGEERAGLLRDLLGEQVGELTRQLLDTLVSGRWSSPAELLDGCELLTAQTLLAGSEQAGDLAEVEDELFRFSQVLDGDAALAAALADPTASVERRGRLVDDLLAGKATDTTRQAVKLALAGFVARSLPAALTRLVELAAERRDRGVAYVTVATPLSEAEERRLGATLSARYGREVSVKTTVDPGVLGGVRVKVGADLYDGTIAYRLAQARNALTAG